MVYKRFKSDAADKLLRKETNLNFINPRTCKVDIKMLTKHLCTKDENSTYELKVNAFDDSSDSDNPLLACLLNDSEADDIVSGKEQIKPDNKTKKKRKARNGTFNVVTFNGRKIKAKHRYSAWFMLYVENPDVTDSNFLKDFRRRFRLPYFSYKELLNDLKKNPIFTRWWDFSCSAAGIPCSPMELLLLGSLRYLGRGWTFDDVSESTGISVDVVVNFFETFVTFGSGDFYDKHVTVPKDKDEFEYNFCEFNSAGFTGCCGSTDAVNIVCDKLSWKYRQQHLGYKQSLTARSFNVTVNHRRKILHVTSGFPARWNDKTIVKFDQLINNIKNDKLCEKMIFKLFEKMDDGTIVEVSYAGAWLICDNGYLHWPMLVPPFKMSSNRMEIRFSEWLESIRKNVECTFGILKQRWRILKTGIRIHSLEIADKIFKTCCALHNFLLDADGVDMPWEGEHKCDYEDNDFEDYNPQSIPNAVHELYRDYGHLNMIDLSSAGANDMFIHENFVTENSHDNDSNDEDPIGQFTDTDEHDFTSIRHVNSLSLDFFRSKLVEHFNILFEQNKLSWPKAIRREQAL